MAFYSVIESVAKLTAMGGDYRHARLTFQEYFERLGMKAERWGKPFAALLGAYKAQEELGIPAIGGKDSMSGTFDNIDVPPSLVSFAVGYELADRIISPELKVYGSSLVLLKTTKLEDGLIDMKKFKKNMTTVYDLIGAKKVISASAIKFGGVSEAITKMALGNKVGVNLDKITQDELFGFNYGSLLLEVKPNVDIEKEFEGLNYKVIGTTIADEMIISKEYDFKLDINTLEEVYEEKLSEVF